MTSNTARLVSLLTRTSRITMISSMVTPSAAVTVTLSSFWPVARSVAPVTTKSASASDAITSTSTDSVPVGSSTTSPSITSTPLTVNVDREVSVFRATSRLIV